MLQDTTNTLQPANALLPLAGIVLMAVVAVLLRRRGGTDARMSDVAWAVPQVIVLVALTGLCAMGNLACGHKALAAAVLVATTMGALALARPKVRALVDARLAEEGGSARAHAMRAVASVACIAVATALSMVALELPWNLGALPTEPIGIAIELAVLLGMLAALWLVAGRHAGAAVVVPVASTVMGLVQYFVIVLKSQPLMPSDILAAGTAAAVSGGYAYILPAGGVLALACCSAAIGALSLLPVPDRTALPVATRRRNVAGNVVGGVAVVAAMGGALAGVPIKEATPLFMDYWSSEGLHQCYSRQGFVPTFAIGLQDFPIQRPTGYSDEAATKALADWAGRYDDDSAERAAARQQFDAQRPSIIVVMNETFADLSSYYGDLGCGYEGPTFFKTGLTGTLARGNLTVPVLGGGTANTEFEFLTGNSCAFIGYGKHPYAMYDLSRAGDGVVSQMNDLGYQTTAIHPNLASNWNRDVAYKNLGFQRFLDIDDFEDAPTLHMGVTDGATYDKVLELLKNSDQPQFIFDVTMQNHSGYDKGNLPAQYQLGYQIPGLDEDDNAQTNEYLGCIKASDEDLQHFVSELSKLDRPVILVFFGDHQPSVSPALNDLTHPNENELVHQEREFVTPYAIWANYDVAGSAQVDARVDTGASNLAALALSLVGAPLTERQQASLAISREVVAANCFGYLGTDGVWHPLDDASAPSASALADQANIQYHEFATKVQ